MKQTTIHHEILFYTSSSFSRRCVCGREEKDTDKKFLLGEDLERACWDGMLYEMFPEILGSFSTKCESFIWHIMKGKNCLRIRIGPTSVRRGDAASIDPYFFMFSVCTS